MEGNMSNNTEAKYQVFISYRRVGGDAFAKLLVDNIKKEGYSVFYDYDGLGSGDYGTIIEDAIKNCIDYIILLSKDSLVKRSGEDKFFAELALAIKEDKNIIPVFLNGFDIDLYNNMELSADIKKIKKYNGLLSDMGDFSHWFNKLQEKFFKSIPNNVNKKIKEDISKDDENFKKISIDDNLYRQMDFILKINNEFNNNKQIQKLYSWLEESYRSIGELSKKDNSYNYNGNKPSDYVIYLTFFETIYLMVKTNTIDMVLIDELFRYRFFIMVNNYSIQNEELLPYGYSYSNIVELYNLWIDYLAAKYSDIPLKELVINYQNKFNTRYKIYEFSNTSIPIQNVKVYNNKNQHKKLSLKRVSENELEDVIALQSSIMVDTIIRGHELFQESSDDELVYSLENDFCYGFYSNDEEKEKLIAFLLIQFAPKGSRSLLNDLYNVDYITFEDKDTELDKMENNNLVLDTVFVDKKFRGFGIQELCIELCKNIAKKRDVKYILATVSPENIYSSKNFLEAGFYKIANKLVKYQGQPRDYLRFDLN